MFNKNEFNAMLARKGMSKEDLAKELGINRVSLYRRLNSGEFNVRQTEKMFDLFSVKEVIKALYNRELE